jgi:hypothetical protein
MDPLLYRFIKIFTFLTLWAVLSRVLLNVFKKKRPELKIYEPEVIFPAVLAAAVLTKGIMMALAVALK